MPEVGIDFVGHGGEQIMMKFSSELNSSKPRRGSFFVTGTPLLGSTSHLNARSPASISPQESGITMCPPREKCFETKVCDADGNPIVAYHGTTKSFERFLADYPLSVGLHFGSCEQANFRVRGRNTPVFFWIFKYPLIARISWK